MFSVDTFLEELSFGQIKSIDRFLENFKNEGGKNTARHYVLRDIRRIVIEEIFELLTTSRIKSIFYLSMLKHLDVLTDMSSKSENFGLNVSNVQNSHFHGNGALDLILQKGSIPTYIHGRELKLSQPTIKGQLEFMGDCSKLIRRFKEFFEEVIPLKELQKYHAHVIFLIQRIGDVDHYRHSTIILRLSNDPIIHNDSEEIAIQLNINPGYKSINVDVGPLRLNYKIMKIENFIQFFITLITISNDVYSPIWRTSGGSSGSNIKISNFEIKDRADTNLTPIDPTTIFSMLNKEGEILLLEDILDMHFDGMNQLGYFNLKNSNDVISLVYETQHQRDNIIIEKIIADVGMDTISVQYSMEDDENEALLNILLKRDGKVIYLKKDTSKGGYYDVTLPLGEILKVNDLIRVILSNNSQQSEIRSTFMDRIVQRNTTPETVFYILIRSYLSRFNLNLTNSSIRDLIKILDELGHWKRVKSTLNAKSAGWIEGDFLRRLDVLRDAASLFEDIFGDLATYLELDINSSRLHNFLSPGKLISGDPSSNFINDLRASLTFKNKVPGKKNLEQSAVNFASDTAVAKWGLFLSYGEFILEDSSSKEIRKTFSYLEQPFVITFFLRNGKAHKSPIHFIQLASRQDWYLTALDSVITSIFWTLNQASQFHSIPPLTSITMKKELKHKAEDSVIPNEDNSSMSSVEIEKSLLTEPVRNKEEITSKPKEKIKKSTNAKKSKKVKKKTKPKKTTA